MRISAHILAIIAIMICLINTGQAKAIHASAPDCPSSQSQYSSAQASPEQSQGDRLDIPAVIASAPNAETSIDDGDTAPLGDDSQSLKFAHCSVSWANLASNLADIARTKGKTFNPIAFEAGQGLQPAALERPPKSLLS
ncbi:MAG: hypothetical protein N4A65_04290 [Cohaesibacter sp.]|jgi:outer membrane receptor for monomeric catechols|nr:hypothetical protein [Cohaesibacter sp.]